MLNKILNHTFSLSPHSASRILGACGKVSNFKVNQSYTYLLQRRPQLVGRHAIESIVIGHNKTTSQIFGTVHLKN